jgi:CubicO group peptidase (beta-lactamase class C family)
MFCEMCDSIDSLMSGFPPAVNDQVKASAWRKPRHARWAFSHLRQLLPTAPIAASPNPAKLTSARQNLTDLAFSDHANQQHDVQQFLKASHTDAFAVMHRGQLVFDWFDGFGAADRPHIIFSITKSMAALLAGVLVGRGMLDPENFITDYLPELTESAYYGATIRHLLDMQIASGFHEDYTDSDGIFMTYRRAAAWNPVEEGDETEGLRHFLTQMPESDAVSHGQSHHYCSPHSDVLGWVIERAGNDSFAKQFSTCILQPCGCLHDGYITLDTFGAPRVSGGMCLGLHDLLIIGEMVRNRGYANGHQVVPASWIDDMIAARDNRIWRAQNQGEGHRLFANGNYRSLWYQTGFKNQEFCAIGIHGQWLWINPQKEIVIVKMASHDSEVDSAIDRIMLAAFAAISAELS